MGSRPKFGIMQRTETGEEFRYVDCPGFHVEVAAWEYIDDEDLADNYPESTFFVTELFD